jgi:RNA recognition motif-containing protein
MTESDEISTEKWRESILALLDGEKSLSAKNEGKVVTVRRLRKMVMMSLQLDETDKDAKKRFKAIVKELEKESYLLIDSDGTISFELTRKRHSSNEENESKKRLKKHGNDDEAYSGDGLDVGGEAAQEKEEFRQDSSKNRSCRGNPKGVTRLFLGNLPFAVDEASLAEFLPGTVTHIKWITDKATGKFYGSAFVEMDTSQSAAEAVAMAGSQLMGRAIKVNFAPAREGDSWPPEKKVMSGGGSGSGASASTTGGQAGGKGIKALGEKPANCVKLFIGNLSYDIDDEGIRKFFASVDAEMKAVRWLHHLTGDFKGWYVTLFDYRRYVLFDATCSQLGGFSGFVEFWNTEACQKAATLNGQVLLGRPIRIDWAE